MAFTAEIAAYCRFAGEVDSEWVKVNLQFDSKEAFDRHKESKHRDIEKKLYRAISDVYGCREVESLTHVKFTAKKVGSVDAYIREKPKSTKRKLACTDDAVTHLQNVKRISKPSSSSSHSVAAAAVNTAASSSVTDVVARALPPTNDPVLQTVAEVTKLSKNVETGVTMGWACCIAQGHAKSLPDHSDMADVLQDVSDHYRTLAHYMRIRVASPQILVYPFNGTEIARPRQ